MGKHSHYPSFDVMSAKEEWDEHTRTIVSGRLKSQEGLQFLTLVEAELLKQISSLLVNDSDPEVLQFVVGYMDQILYQSFGEGQRKAGIPEASVLIRAGLRAIEQGVVFRYGTSFLKLDAQAKKQYLQQISRSMAEPKDIWKSVPQEALFQKLLQLTVESYCSHPKVWSVIGYAGPAYPRGYVRTQLGQLDPWEAQPE